LAPKAFKEGLILLLEILPYICASLKSKAVRVGAPYYSFLSLLIKKFTQFRWELCVCFLAGTSFDGDE
jgi:hypothetical protein